jgi:hypothetical protein
MEKMSSHDIMSSMQFVRADSKDNRRYITPGVEINTGKYETRQVLIHDVRPRLSEFTLDTTGFQLFNHKTAVLPSSHAEMTLGRGLYQRGRNQGRLWG